MTPPARPGGHRGTRFREGASVAGKQPGAPVGRLGSAGPEAGTPSGAPASAGLASRPRGWGERSLSSQPRLAANSQRFPRPLPPECWGHARLVSWSWSP